MDLIYGLQVSVALIFFVNKLLVLVGKKSGWLIGVVGAILCTFYFYLLDLYIFTVFEMGLIVLMGYGFLKREQKNPRVEQFIQMTTVSLVVLLAILTFSGVLTILEVIGTFSGIVGTYFLTHNKERYGWLLYIVGHVTTAYLTYLKGQQFFVDFQIASALVAVVGMTKKNQ